VGGTAGAIITCPLEVVKTRLQSSNSGFDTTLKAVEVAAAPQAGTTTCRTLPPPPQHKRFWARPETTGGLYRPVLGPPGRFTVSLFSSGRSQGAHLTDRQAE
jgi:solute carrier family 25 protein 33/36